MFSGGENKRSEQQEQQIFLEQRPEVGSALPPPLAFPQTFHLAVPVFNPLPESTSGE